MRIEWEGAPGTTRLEGANVDMGNGVVVELATVGQGYPHTWGVWGVRIDGKIYREPRDLRDAGPLEPGPFRDWVEQEAERAAAKARAGEVSA
jgi:hypothetical protein